MENFPTVTSCPREHIYFSKPQQGIWENPREKEQLVKIEQRYSEQS